MKTIGIISAMPEEVASLLLHLKNVTENTIGMRTYYKGILHSNTVIITFSRWGKVAAAATTTQLINDYQPDEIIFTGVAGAVDNALNVGDVVYGTKLYQHDMDPRPLFQQFEIPLLDKISFKTTANKLLESCIQNFLAEKENYLDEAISREFRLEKATYHRGTILSGDQFINSIDKVKNLKNSITKALCVEMEGAAVAQVCYEYTIPFNILRLISDKADESAAIDFPKFTQKVAAVYASNILVRYIEQK